MDFLTYNVNKPVDAAQTTRSAANDGAESVDPIAPTRANQEVDQDDTLRIARLPGHALLAGRSLTWTAPHSVKTNWGAATAEHVGGRDRCCGGAGTTNNSLLSAGMPGGILYGPRYATR
ncbi:hypothetical protein [Achromobacter sp. DH1f]|uniref:hypothetical protein n=1 Tax=Achromobacter sp. DH1f TaxID=1397275 RepID=UPI000E207C78|nr:hypothetical protein [Achromobacter sp. DH1f]